MRCGSGLCGWVGGWVGQKGGGGDFTHSHWSVTTRSKLRL